ncbi:MAG: cell division protein CrgA [Acidimicrobiales bacterium]
MATDKRPAPSRRTGGRVTPKGGPTKKSAEQSHGGPEASTRYTPRAESIQMPSPVWLPFVMFGLFLLGLVVIFLHYVDVILPGASSNWWLLGGLGFILGGIITATQYR